MSEYLAQAIRLIIFTLPIWIIARIVINKFRKKVISKKREFLLIIFFIYVVSLASVTVVPNIMIHLSARIPNIKDINCVPVINTIKGMEETPDNMKTFMIKFWIENIFGNIIMFIPLGIFLPLLYEKFRSVKKVVLFCMCVSVCIEIIQFLSEFIGTYRSCDIDDVILNTLGGFIGIILFKKFQGTVFKKGMDRQL